MSKTDAPRIDGGNPTADLDSEDYVLSARNLRAGYDRIPFLRDVDFGVKQGEVVAVLGANGAGKSTLIMTLAGDVRPSDGEVILNGQSLTGSMDARVRKGGISLITQERSVFMSMTAKQNISLGRGRVSDVVELFPELEPHLGRRVGLLSGGQQQMLAVARAICANPRVILADEVSLGLAPKITERLLSALTSAAVDRGVAVVIVEQFVAKALQHSNRAYVLNRGRVVLEGRSSELLERQADLAQFYL